MKGKKFTRQDTKTKRNESMKEQSLERVPHGCIYIVLYTSRSCQFFYELLENLYNLSLQSPYV